MTHKLNSHEPAALSTRTFKELGIDEKIGQALAENGFEKPFPIQEAVIPLILSGNDVIGQAHTGTGKTTAYALPLLTKMVHGDGASSKSLQVLIMVPTRELAMQVRNEIVKFSRHLHIWTVSIYGGDSFARQTKLLRGGAQIVVATPGRLMDHMRRGSIKLETVKYVVLDEADTMLDMGFIEDIQFILSKIGKTDSKGRQTMLFSATMSQEILALAKKHMHEGNTREIRLNKQEVALNNIEQSYLIVNENQKLNRLVSFLRPAKEDTKWREQEQAIVFSATRLRADKLAANLRREGFKVSAIHGDLSQNERDRVMGRFRQGIENILVATDIAARGIDVPSVGHVINYDVPNEPETYFHRIGRTARAGADGKATSLVTPERLGEFERILKLTKLPIKRLNEAMGIVVPSAHHGDNRGSYYRGGELRHRSSYAGQRRRPDERSRHYGSRNHDRSSKSGSSAGPGARREWKH
jgi:ATP-dependent RNA helicase DeaD